MMKKLYTLALLLSLAGFVNAQSAVSGCTTETGLEITFDDAANCAAAPGDLSALTEIGFHSGANQWAAVIDWDNMGATTGAAEGNGIFKVTIDNLEDYYGITGIENVYFVFNQGPENADEPWASEGKEDDGAGGCADFALILADLEACATSATQDVVLANAITVAPNPFTDFAVINIDNPQNEVFNITLTTMAGQTVKVVRNFNGEQLEVERGDLSAGMYFLTIMNEEGRFATKKVVVR